MDADIGVVGLGAIGSMALWRIASRGASVMGYDRFGIGHHRGASGGQTRRFAACAQRDPRHTPLALEALDLWRALEKESGRTLLTLTGGLVIGDPSLPGIQSALASLRDHDLEHELINTRQLRDQFPQHAVTDGECGLVDRLTGYLRPEISIVSAVESAERCGAVVRQHTRVRSIEPDPYGVTVVTDSGSHRHRQVVLAPGPWAPWLPGTAELDVVARRQVQGWYVPRDLVDYRAEVFPVFEHLRGEGERVYGFPSVDDATVKVGVYLGPYPQVADMEAVDLWVDPALARRLAERAQQFLPGLSGDPVLTSVHFEGYSPDLLPLLGPLPGAPRVVVACGFSGAGFKFSSVMGDILADHVLDGCTRRDTTFMLPDRAAARD